MSILDKITKPTKKNWEIEEYKQFSTLRLISIMVIGFLITSFMIGLYFIYQNIYQAIDQAQTIIIFKNNLGDEIINFETLDKVKNNWDLKHSDTLSAFKRDPFNFNATSTSKNTITPTNDIPIPEKKNNQPKVQLGV